jgi:predicted AAA+ superfamily ATPase
MKQLIYFLQSERAISEKNILYINLETEYAKFPTLKSLDTAVRQQIKRIKGRLYLFIDEVQELKGREKQINAYRADDTLDIDIFITGSNANLLGGELATYMAGRYLLFEVLPFSYTEYLGYFQLENTKERFSEYLHFSGISELYNLPNKETQINFLSAMKDSIILKDIVSRYSVKDVELLETLFHYLAGNIGNMFSITAIVKKFKSLNIHTNTTTI